MRCFYVLKKWSSAKLSLNRDFSLNKVSLNPDCTVLKDSCFFVIFGQFSQSSWKKLENNIFKGQI